MHDVDDTMIVDMDQLRCHAGLLPPYLYRVQYDGCVTVHNHNGLFAADTSAALDAVSLADFRNSIVDQFTRANREPTPYISLFSDREHAENWALKMGMNVRLLCISTALWDKPYVFKLSTLIHRLPVTIPSAASQHINGAYLCLHSIPGLAIVEILDKDDIERRVDNRRYREYFLPFDPDDSEDEAIENNWNDDLMKMIEGDWER